MEKAFKLFSLAEKNILAKYKKRRGRSAILSQFVKLHYEVKKLLESTLARSDTEKGHTLTEEVKVKNFFKKIFGEVFDGYIALKLDLQQLDLKKFSFGRKEGVKIFRSKSIRTKEYLYELYSNRCTYLTNTLIKLLNRNKYMPFLYGLFEQALKENNFDKCEYLATTLGNCYEGKKVKDFLKKCFKEELAEHDSKKALLNSKHLIY